MFSGKPARRGGETRRRNCSVYIPARREVRPSQAQRVVPFLLIPCGVFLLAVCLWEPPRSCEPFYAWVILGLGVLLADLIDRRVPLPSDSAAPEAPRPVRRPF